MPTVTIPQARTRRLCSALIACALSSAGAHAAYYSTTTTSVSGSSYGNGPYDQTFHTGAAPGGSQADSAVNSSSGKRVIEGGTQGSARAETGGVHVVAAANVRLNNPDYNLNLVVAASSTAHASFSDSLVITAPGLAAGTAALLTYRVNVSGDLGIEGGNSWNGGWNASSYWSFTATLGSISTFRSLLNDWAPGSSERLLGDGRFGSLDITVPVILGTVLPFSLGGNASASVSLGSTPYEPSSGQFAAFSNLGNTIGWGGIVMLKTAEGAPINTYSALGDSGFDYRQAYVSAVPEPAPAALFAGGLLVLMAMRRR
ncbi:MAG: hypothetical protein Q8Q80_00225 [Methyloversatilis sp.]|uniref:hypothetical protein n=1 Tax=Methyloversatilis sp. TaxID=2569862 RepID=UPI00273564A0|nr:hypothetical protein [Methyloversatilis sp.]MDP3871064.1 hypothetical protein [Methyloversatilis sp.]